MNNVKLFENKKIRTHWDKQKEEWYFSVVDVITILTNSLRPRKYWNDLKMKLSNEGSQLSAKIGQLKFESLDGKKYLTDVLNTKDILRLIQSIPSPKAEPFKLWLAQVGNDRIDEIYDPEKAIQRAIVHYHNKGYSDEWINERFKGIQMRKSLTDEWKRTGLNKPSEYAILTDIMTKEWSSMTTKQYKDFKSLTKENLRDNMSGLELAINFLAEQTSKEISVIENPSGFKESTKVVKRGGKVANIAKQAVEQETKRAVVNSENNIGLDNKKEIKGE